MIVADLRILTMGTDSSLEGTVEDALAGLDEEGVRYSIGPLGTTLEAEDMDTLLSAVKKAHAHVKENAPRVFTQLTIDERLDKRETAESLTQVEH